MQIHRAKMYILQPRSLNWIVFSERKSLTSIVIPRRCAVDDDEVVVVALLGVTSFFFFLGISTTIGPTREEVQYGMIEVSFLNQNKNNFHIHKTHKLHTMLFFVWKFSFVPKGGVGFCSPDLFPVAIATSTGPTCHLPRGGITYEYVFLDL